MQIIAHAHNAFTDKFGIPRQPLADSVIETRIIFTPPFRHPDAIRGIEGFSHIWLLWEFEHSQPSKSLTVRPPRLGGNTRVGVFATRSPFRPNPIGLTCVRLLRIENGELIVAGADLRDGTPIFDIKPYLPWADSHPDASGGFAAQARDYRLRVDWSQLKEASVAITERQKQALEEILSQDPRPSYQNDPERVYKLDFDKLNIAFRVIEDILYVTEIHLI